MKINGAWYVDALPSEIVVEFIDGTLSHFFLTPFRKVAPADFKAYAGYHPRKCKGQPLPAYLYPYYGLEKSDESLSEVLRVRLSPSELEKIKAAAAAQGSTVSEFAREWVREL